MRPSFASRPCGEPLPPRSGRTSSRSRMRGSLRSRRLSCERRSTFMRAIMVCVDMADILAVTLPLNRHHFEEVWVVTSHADHDAVRIAGDNEARVLKTNLFWEDSAIFNKWRALEHGLDVMGREGWLCVMDADVIRSEERRV